MSPVWSMQLTCSLSVRWGWILEMRLFSFISIDLFAWRERLFFWEWNLKSLSWCDRNVTVFFDEEWFSEPLFVSISILRREAFSQFSMDRLFVFFFSSTNKCWSVITLIFILSLNAKCKQIENNDTFSVFSSRFDWFGVSPINEETMTKTRNIGWCLSSSSVRRMFSHFNVDRSKTQIDNEREVSSWRMISVWKKSAAERSFCSFLCQEREKAIVLPLPADSNVDWEEMPFDVDSKWESIHLFAYCRRKGKTVLEELRMSTNSDKKMSDKTSFDCRDVQWILPRVFVPSGTKKTWGWVVHGSDWFQPRLFNLCEKSLSAFAAAIFSILIVCCNWTRAFQLFFHKPDPTGRSRWTSNVNENIRDEKERYEGMNITVAILLNSHRMKCKSRDVSSMICELTLTASWSPVDQSEWSTPYSAHYSAHLNSSLFHTRIRPVAPSPYSWFVPYKKTLILNSSRHERRCHLIR